MTAPTTPTSPASPRSWAFSNASTFNNARVETAKSGSSGREPAKSVPRRSLVCIKHSVRQRLASWRLCSAVPKIADEELAEMQGVTVVGAQDTKQEKGEGENVCAPQEADDSIESSLSCKFCAAEAAERERLITAEHHITQTRVHTLEETQEGYPRVAAFLASEPGFSMYRGFSYAHSRVLLDLQAEINELEKELADVDEFDAEKSEAEGTKNPLKNRTLDVEAEREWQKQKDKAGSAAADEKEDGDDLDLDLQMRPRRVILKELHVKLLAYDELLIKARELGSFQRPSDRDYRNMRTHFFNTGPLVLPEEAFIQQKEDFVSLRHGREWGCFDGWVENVLRRFHCKTVQRLFTTPELREKTSNPNIHYYATSRVERLVCLLVTIVIGILLILPVVTLYQLTAHGRPTESFNAVGVLVVFTLLFAAAMSMLTKAQRHEIFAASAAYCAVLVVFISNFND